MKHLTLLSLFYFGIAVQAQHNFRYLDINQVKAGINSNGNLHFTPSGFLHAYEVPKGSGKHSNSFTNLWFGGMYNNQLHLAAERISLPGSDFNSGPLTLLGSAVPTNTVQYTRVWKLNKTDINDFIANYANGNVQNGSYIPAPDLLSWPGTGDISKNEDVNLAPYVDVNGDNIYNPMTGGDYPSIKGDQTLFFIYNDVTASPHGSGGQALGLEIHCMAYAYGTCSVVAATPALDYTTFYDYTIINRSTRTYTDFYTSLYSEADLGQFNDDYIGCDVKDNYGYIYNGDNDDETLGSYTGYGLNPPAAAFALLRSPQSATDGIDNDGDGITDEQSEQMGMTNFSYFITYLVGVPPEMGPPFMAMDYYNYMHSIWKDGSAFTCNMPLAHGGAISTPYVYPGITYTNSACGSSNWSETVAAGARRYILSTKKSSFQPGESIFLEYAHVTSFPASGSALTKLDQDVNAVKAFYESGTASSCVATSLSEQLETNAFKMYPNPASSVITVSSLQSKSAKIEITDVYGKVLLSTNIGNRESTQIDISTFASGIYFVKVSLEGKSVVQKFIRQ